MQISGTVWLRIVLAIHVCWQIYHLVFCKFLMLKHPQLKAATIRFSAYLGLKTIENLCGHKLLEILKSMQWLKRRLVDLFFHFFFCFFLYPGLLALRPSWSAPSPDLLSAAVVPASRWSATRRWAEFPSVCRSQWPSVSPVGCANLKRFSTRKKTPVVGES